MLCHTSNALWNALSIFNFTFTEFNESWYDLIQLKYCFKKFKTATAFHKFKPGSMWIWLQRDKVFYTSKSNWYFSMIVDKIRPGSRGRRVKKGIFCCLVSTQHPFQVYWCSYLRGKLNFALGSDLLLSPAK